MLRNSSIAAPAALSTRTSPLGRLLALAATWLERPRSRKALAELDERLLRDIGLSPVEASAETAMPFWKPFVWMEKK